MSKAAIILAAGQGTRMKSALPKVLHKIAGPGSIFPAGAGTDERDGLFAGKMRPSNQKQARDE